MKNLRFGWWVCLSIGCGGAEFTAPGDVDAGQGGASASSSSAMTTGMTAVGSTTSSTTGGGGSGGTGGNGTGGTVDAGRDAPVSCDAAMPSPVTFRMRRPDNTDYCVNNCNGIWVS